MASCVDLNPIADLFDSSASKDWSVYPDGGGSIQVQISPNFLTVISALWRQIGAKKKKEKKLQTSSVHEAEEYIFNSTPPERRQSLGSLVGVSVLRRLTVFDATRWLTRLSWTERRRASLL